MGGSQLSGKPIALRRGVRPAAREVGHAGAEVLSLAIERFVRCLKGGVFVDDLLQLANPRQVLAGDISLFRDFTLQR